MSENNTMPQNSGNYANFGNGNWFNFIKQSTGGDGKISTTKLIWAILGALATIGTILCALEAFGVINIIK